LTAVQEPEFPGTSLELRTKRGDGEAETGAWPAFVGARVAVGIQ
jgi:hypothetical protein